MILLPADQFTLEELTKAYNQTRIDYIIPMPMNPGRLQEYITLYDVDLSCSRVAVDGESIVGLGMLGVRADKGWITRLGVLPEGRRKGVGSMILQALLDEAENRQFIDVWLEVIQGNAPAHDLFIKYDFRETRDLIVARRSPKTVRNPSAIQAARKILYLQHEEVIDLYCKRRETLNWLNTLDTMRNVRRLVDSAYAEQTDNVPQHESVHLAGIFVEFQDGAQGWACYQATTLQLARISVEVVRGDPRRTAAGVLEILHRLHASQDAVIENIPDDERWAGFVQAGYFEVFRRIEMVRNMKLA